MGKTIPSVLDHRQQGLDIGFVGAEKLDQIGKALARVRRPVMLKDQLLDVLDRRFTVEAHKKI